MRRLLIIASLGLSLGACATLGAPLPVEAGRIETAPSVFVYYQRHGNGEQVIIAPGRLFFAERFSALARPNRTLILYDMRNRGASSQVAEGTPLTIMDDVRDMEAVRKHFGVERFTLIGHSYLGLMAALYTVAYPQHVDRLVQLGPIARRLDAEYPASERAGADSLSAEGREAADAWIRARDAATLQTDPRELCAIEARFMSFWLVGDQRHASDVVNTCNYENEWPINTRRHFRALFGDLQTRDFPRDMFDGLATHVLTIHGTLDRNAPYGAGREWASTFVNGRLVTVLGGAHNVWLDDPSVLEDISQFVDGAWPARAEDVQ